MNKHKIVHVSYWGFNRRKAWSGTCYSLYSALKKICAMQDVKIKASLSHYLMAKIFRRGSYYCNFYLDLQRFDSDSKIRDTLKDKIVFTYSEIDNCEDNNCYIYQDMCAKYIHDEILSDKQLNDFLEDSHHLDIVKERITRQRIFYNNCKGIFVMGEWLREYMINCMNIPAYKVHCVGAGYDIDVSKCREENKSSNKILFVGRDFERKGGKMLLEAFSILKEKYQSNAELYIVGAVRRYGKDECDGVHWIGEVNHRKILKYYNKCDIFCMPSLIEPYGKVYIEALCCGLPVIALNRFATPDFIVDGKNGYLVDANAEVLALKMFDLLHNQEIKTYVNSRMSFYRRKYSWNTVANNIYNIISESECEKI